MCGCDSWLCESNSFFFLLSVRFFFVVWMRAVLASINYVVMSVCFFFNIVFFFICVFDFFGGG